ncbi:MAG: hypothetical protein A3G33_02975 [Omnitrophica bacterium RIFCSPLOWO2_12_FULL_44_17]|uniref:Uncharacterized protein n=1 Tax=Candidatus Danuiimicrobium aquiferis TaxID=1801832 RepID=A0A1G1KVY3_9BACT|nr:MAG: hypothetical protein A3B72_04455 [Omnitrophica bacterium RIFCSPHIGHO2_02_FULL_45_28]OGW90434.1 MAG: hypothetical protein A3E74_04270 [Omnitrophica bacterium RIFCSPHIGHO2_12_FULL_44_12]OGW96942.1 MAG: hypothetical protein A3G33_02975 [Omnitrophica bacterium RIFCSPLOWO2_12_FULL_44_17]OGX03922.1 MAG: hypothetical protein A3J12_03440 [Omnitrophica bacterium RIFCSPLOWO2_02_FULL_44_11]
MRRFRILFILISVAFVLGCASSGKPIKKIVEPIQKASDEIGETRTLGKERTYAVVSPRDDKKLTIPF